jgi:hypothetical protein
MSEVQRGRPRDIALDTAIANATEAVLLSHGYAAIQIDRVAKPTGDAAKRGPKVLTR